jgi:hypothetical protein
MSDPIINRFPLARGEESLLDPGLYRVEQLEAAIHEPVAVGMTRHEQAISGMSACYDGDRACNTAAAPSDPSPNRGRSELVRDR